MGYTSGQSRRSLGKFSVWLQLLKEEEAVYGLKNDKKKSMLSMLEHLFFFTHFFVIL